MMLMIAGFVVAVMLPSVIHAQEITLNPPVVLEVPVGGALVDPGGTLVDATGNPLPWSNVVITNEVNLGTAGTYQIKYNYPGAFQRIRYVNVTPAAAAANAPPIISAADPLQYTQGAADVTVSNNVMCTDAEDGNIGMSSGLSISQNSFPASTAVGDYPITITCEDSDGAVTTKNITVRVISTSCGSVGGTCKGGCGAGESSTVNSCIDPFDICCTPIASPPAGAGSSPPVSAYGAGGFVTCSGLDCSVCNLVDMANEVIKWLIAILFIVFAILLFIAGWKLVTSVGNPSAMSDAKAKITNAIIGILIVLTAWLIIDTFVRALVGDTGQINGLLWTDIQCHEQVYAEFEGYGDSWGVGTYSPGVGADLGTIGTGNTAVVDCANVFDAQQCLYSQANRNGCTGTPGYTDCSDLVNTCYRAAGCSSPGTNTGNMHPKATAIGDPSTLQPGDAVVYRNSSNTAGHVVICVNVGCSQVIHARGRGAPDGQPAKYAPSEQIIVSNGSTHINKPGAKVLRAADYCP
jgi:hypothetical protein